MADADRQLLATLEDAESGHSAWPCAPTMALFGGLWLIFAWPWLSGAVTIPWDAKAHFAPQVQFMAASFARGEWPFWNPYAFGGHPQIADPQSMIFSPPMLILALANGSPSLWAIDATVLTMLLVAGLGVIWLARDLGWHWVGALVAALGFAFGAAMAWRLQHFGQVFSLAYFPFALLFLRRALERESIGYGLLAGLAGAFIVLGRDQVALLSVYLLIGYVVWFWLRDGWQPAALIKTLPPLLAGGVLGAAIIALPILMTAQLAADSNRPTIDYAGAAAGSLHPALLVTAVVPHLFGAAGEMADYWGPPSFTWENTGLFIAQNMGLVYIGAMSFVLLGVGLARGYLWTREIGYFVIALVIVMLYALGWYTPFFRAAYNVLPGVDLYRRPADAVFVIGGLAALVAGYVAHRLMRETLEPGLTPWQWSMAIALPIGVLALATAFAMAFDRLQQAAPAILLAVLWLAVAGLALAGCVWLKPIRPIAAGLLLVLPTGLDLAINNGPNGASALPIEALEMLETNKPNATIAALKRRVTKGSSATRRPRVELAGLGFHWPNASLSHGLENTLGYNPVRLRLYSRAVGAGDTVGLPDQRKFTALFPSYRSTLANLLGLRYIASGVAIEQIDKKLEAGSLPLITRTNAGYIYENRDARPRVSFATAARRADFEEILKSGNWPGVDLDKTVLIEDDVALGLRRKPGTAKIVSYRNTVIEIETRSPGGGWLVLNDVWHPWWRATVEGETVKIHRANVLFRAVKVGRGRQVVRFEFRPISGAVSALIARKNR